MSEKCIICSCDAAETFIEVDGYVILRCLNCSTDFVAPTPTDLQMKEFYDRAEWFEGGERGGYASYDMQTDGSPKWLVDLMNDIRNRVATPSILDVGCAYGTHLALARANGWQCFGVEPSQHARQTAQGRHRGIYFTETIEEIPPHRFDLVIMLEVIEHLGDPYRLFYEMFSKGQIDHETIIAITTPNARSWLALADPAGWEFRHPPSHLTFYSGLSFKAFLERLRFASIKIEGQHPLNSAPVPLFKDEDGEVNEPLSSYAGLRVIAKGSDFSNFMQERFVPGTWSELTAYEHLPRYLLAHRFATGRRVLDFGCGSGYGARLLADSAQHVLGVDIDDGALDYARAEHRSPNLKFRKVEDLCDSFGPAEFDLITCFEVIEHVSELDQQRLVQNFRRLLKPKGILAISTPNPDVTSLYGHNPYHLKEMTFDEFLGILHPNFAHVEVFNQAIVSGSTLSRAGYETKRSMKDEPMYAGGTPKDEIAAAWIALAGAAPLPDVGDTFFRDNKRDYVRHRIEEISRKNNYEIALFQASKSSSEVADELDETRRQKSELIARHENAMGSVQRELAEALSRLQHIEASLSSRLQKRITSLFRRKRPAVVVEQTGLAYETAREPIWNPHLNCYELIVEEDYMAEQFAKKGLLSNLVPPYVLRPKAMAGDMALAGPKILHVIPNVFVGGSTQLVIDIVEHLSAQFQHEVVTSALWPAGPHVGLNVHKITLEDMHALPDLLATLQPDLVHIHYWGLTDDPWYHGVMKHLGKVPDLPIIENINTPVAPLFSDRISHYVFVSQYVREEFGHALPDSNASVIYPGIDLIRFSDPYGGEDSINAIGMVYRLEDDKLSVDAIDLFIEIVRRRPRTRVYIIGGGSFLQPWILRTSEQGVRQNFRFTGYVPYENLPGWYDRFSMFISPVWKESFGQVTPFAMSKGLVVAGNRIGALPEIVGSDEFFGDGIEEVAGIVVDLLDNPERRESIGAENQRRASSLFSVQTMTDAYEGLYNKFLRDKTPPSNGQ